ncbi:MAG: AbrB/MazE/SpoVT family DNA-binding domain-containing protein [Nitrospirae bacterium]|nr:AbrB/MazE/SpoVT family DNA-binding domain-containing protein [Nitrospirota bacterium]
MITTKEKPFYTEVRERGQVTIPKKLRDQYCLSEGSQLAVIPMGKAILLAPRPLPLDEARRKLMAIMRDSGMSLKDMLKGLDEEREKIAKKHYGKPR